MTEAEFIEAVTDAINKAPSCEAAARRVNYLCSKLAALEGQNPKSEVLLARPGQRRFNGRNNLWTVAWEACPFEQWAVKATRDVSNPKVYAEPSYSFDINFIDL